MIQYFDTDVLVHYVVRQDLTKHQTAQKLIERAAEEKGFIISFLSLNEFAFVLARLGVEKDLIKENLDVFLLSSPKHITETIFNRSRIIANEVGYRNFSDCIHTAIAEEYCSELITFNKNDFKKIKKYTDLEVKIL